MPQSRTARALVPLTDGMRPGSSAARRAATLELEKLGLAEGLTDHGPVQFRGYVRAGATIPARTAAYETDFYSPVPDE